ncbi:MAG: DUF1127 domain-containing protein [Rhodospirillaceae bacterium]|nr:DUF1127 domain-containing protein [Rhodospirillaceae bacterium]MDD9924605.1 DUF1127 domain-containing protein [Rhodospirillaceae bacterium]
MNTQPTLCSEATAPAPFQAGAIMSFLSTAAIRTACTVQVWRERARQRQTLATLNDRMLADIGIDRVAANVEASKPFWRA